LIVIKLSELLGRKKIRQRAVADATGIRPNTISAYWHGNVQRIDVEHLDKLCKYLECEVGDIIEYVEDK
jgi:putative transcriptional regulator